MEQSNSVIENFFEFYASVSMNADAERQASLYADEFLTANPLGSAAYKNNKEFLAWLLQAYDYNKSTGMVSLQVISVKSAPISNEYSFATVEWGARYKKTGKQLIQFEITYLLQLFDNDPKILAYIDHEDQQQVMKAYGLV